MVSAEWLELELKDSLLDTCPTCDMCVINPNDPDWKEKDELSQRIAQMCWPRHWGMGEYIAQQSTGARQRLVVETV